MGRSVQPSLDSELENWSVKETAKSLDVKRGHSNRAVYRLFRNRAIYLQSIISRNPIPHWKGFDAFEALMTHV